MWQKILQNCETDLGNLYQQLQLDPETLPKSLEAAKSFKFKVPQSYVDKIEKGNPNDPLLLQILPSANELVAYPGYNNDPLEEKSKNNIPGLIHKYHGRVLLTLTKSCAINCRYCFRKFFDYENNNVSLKEMEKCFQYIKSKPEIFEIILSGGDPLLANDNIFKFILKEITQLPQITTLRIHTRMLVLIPERMDDSLQNLLMASNLNIIIVTHINHPNEIDEKFKAKINDLHSNGFQIYNQSVLLKNVNDNSETLINLSKKLCSVKITPYYLHLLDKVSGTGHFEVDIALAKCILNTMTNKLPGYLVPKLVFEQANALAKVAITG